MADSGITALTGWLEEKHAQLKELENSGLAMLEAGDDPGYRAKMRERAEAIAGLATEAKPLLEKLPPATRSIAESRLNAFANGGTTSLRLGSVFYMSALLYPDDHRQGEPDNMERLINELRQSQGRK